MEVLRLKLFQETACYKKPAAFKVGETYPLPPYSTVKGMLHALIGAKEFVPMKINIQGEYEARLVDYQKHYFFKRRDVAEFPLVTDGLAEDFHYENITSMPIYMHMLFHVYLVIHVHADSKTLDAIEEGLRQGVSISLGRWEDLVRIDECKRVQLYPTEEAIRMPLPMYVPIMADLEETIGIPYRLNWRYEIRQGVRQWEKISVRYLQKGDFLEGKDLLTDTAEDGMMYPVVFPIEMGE